MEHPNLELMRTCVSHLVALTNVRLDTSNITAYIR
jgi:hypothetical protein